jgi:hypothetical protein
MLYDLNNKFQLMQAETYFEKLKESACVIELKKKVNRTLSQNRYLHLIISWFAVETGYTLEDVKREYFKKLCNPEIFLKEQKGILGEIISIRSSADLDSKEMTTAIERFRNWSAKEAGIYLPDANEDEWLKQIEIEISKHERWI